MKVKLSKKNWEAMGRKAGWMKTAQPVDPLEQAHQQYRSQMKGAKPVYVSLYEIEKCYGGPEEGGWWFDRWTMLSSKKFFDAEEAQTFCDNLNAEVKASGANDEELSSSRGMDAYPASNDPMHDHSDAEIPVGFSGLARNQRAVVEETAGEFETKETPHYE